MRVLSYKGNTTRLQLGVAVAMLLYSMQPCLSAAQPSTEPAAHGAATPAHLDIPSQSLATALSSLAEQSGVQLVYRTEEVSSSLVCPPIKWVYTPESALNRLLAGSGLKFYRINERTIGIRSAAARQAAGR